MNSIKQNLIEAENKALELFEETQNRKLIGDFATSSSTHGLPGSISNTIIDKSN